MSTSGLLIRATLGVLLCVAASSVRGQEGYKVVVHPDNAAVNLSRKQLSEIFLKRMTQWPDGTRALPVDQPEGAPVRESFSFEIHGRKAAAIKSHWLQVVFSGRGVPPPEKEDDREVLAYVRAKPGAVGYVSAGARTDDVKVLRVEP
jgi:ABC-type phosphate transport system substrate-binding protein